MRYPTLEQFIAGEWRPGGDGVCGVVRNPATDEVLAELPRASASDLDDALTAAQDAQAPWRRTPAMQRASILLRAAALLQERVESIALTMTLEQGKTLAEARVELGAAIESFQWYAAEAGRAYGRIIPARIPGARQMVIQEPIGPVAAFTPWNFPANLPARKISAALAAGCTMILKPSEETPASTLALAQALADAGLPKGVLNVVLGVPDQISSHLIPSPVIRKVTFTGSVPVGRHLARLAADHIKPCTLELGGHSAALIFEDADLDTAIPLCALGKTRNAGQVCTSPTRFLVHESIHDEFVGRLVQAMNGVRLGSGLDPSSQMGPLANARRIAAMERIVNEAKSAGARVEAGGERLGSVGNFFRPTVLTRVPTDSEPMNVEAFGPVAMVRPFSTVDDALSEANRLNYGLAAYAFTQSAATAVQVSEELEAGGVGINSFAVGHTEAPFGGTKDSGYGYEGGVEGISAYLHSKYVHHA
ncbi:NAD-dependent succinate-semialdehyde dehydrogenase [Achromobacter piechaudii]|nr:NAD-dependent succinate-semialdehyde dehydrogenase [Achromobacter piechaudii]